MALKSSSDRSVEYLRSEVAMVGMTGCGGKVLSGTAANLARALAGGFSRRKRGVGAGGWALGVAILIRGSATSQGHPRSIASCLGLCQLKPKLFPARRSK